MDKFTGFDLDHKHTLACVVEAGQPGRCRLLRQIHPRGMGRSASPAKTSQEIRDGTSAHLKHHPCSQENYELAT